MTIKEKVATEPRIDIDGPDGNAFNLMGTAMRLGDAVGYDKDVVDNMLLDMQSGDYYHLLSVFEKHFGYLITLETSNTELIEKMKRQH